MSSKMDKYIFLLVISLRTICIAHDSKSLGCYKEDKDNRDLSEEIWSNRTAGLNITECLVTCQQQGFPYAGLGLGATECWCGSSYGKHGVSEGCVESCPAGFPDYTCGGSEAYSIYYTVQKESNCTEKISGKPNNVCLSFPDIEAYTIEEARKMCVSNNQDLVAITTANTMEQVRKIMTNASLRHHSAWVGLKRLSSTASFNWISDLENKYSSGEVDDFWEDREPGSEHLCVVYSSQGGRLKTTSCVSKHIVICQTTVEAGANTEDIGDKIINVFKEYSDYFIVGGVAGIVILIVCGCCCCCMCRK